MFKCRKFEEIYPPEVAEFVYITDDTYTKKQVLRMEHLVLKVLSFDLASPTINQFLTQYFLNHSVNKQVESLSMVSLQQILQRVFIHLDTTTKAFSNQHGKHQSLNLLCFSVPWGAQSG